MQSEIDLSKFWCVNEDCPDYGKRENRNIVFKERYGKKNRALLQCKTCKHCFSETRGTMFFGLNTPREEVLKTLAMIPAKGSIRETAMAARHDKNTICRWLNIAGESRKEVTDYFLRDHNLTKAQVERIWSYLRKREERNRYNPEENSDI
jgi:transposase-like protein